MADHIYNYGSSAYASRLSAAAAGRYSDSSLFGSTRYPSPDPLAMKYYDRGSSFYSAHTEVPRLPSTDIPGIAASRAFLTSSFAGGFGASAAPWGGVDPFSASPALDPVKRPAEAIYHQAILGTQNAFGQSEALFSTNSLAKRPRLESATTLHNHPLRPGEKDCPFYMRTRTCRFGANCKFDHPLWVPEGGIPDWKEAVRFKNELERNIIPLWLNLAAALMMRLLFSLFFKYATLPVLPRLQMPHLGDAPSCRCPIASFAQVYLQIPVIDVDEAPPERPGEPDCDYYLKTQKCKFGSRCKFNHPKDKTDAISGLGQEGAHLPSVGRNQQEIAVQENGALSGDSKQAKAFVPFTPALLHNSKGLPIRPGDTDCPFYLKTGSCKYGAACRYNHPDLTSINPSAAVALGQAVIPPPVTNLSVGILNTAANLMTNIDPRLAQASIAMGQTVYPQRPGELECDFYMKTGQCKFAERCKFHHPIGRTVPTLQEQHVKLTLAGLPRREGTVACPYYMKTGTCNYAAKCRYDHPPPGEAIAMATVQSQGNIAGSEAGAVATTGES